MRTISELAKIILYLTLASATVYLSVLSGTVLVGIQGDVSSTLTHANTVLDSVDHAARTQDAYWTNTAGPELFKTGRAIRTLVDYTNRSLNEPHKGLLSVSTEAITLATLDIHNTNNHLVDEIDKMGTAGTAAIDSTTVTMDTLRMDLNSPQFSELMTHLNVLALHLDGIADNGEKASADLGIAIHRITAPPSGFHRFFGDVWTAAKVSSLFIR